MMSSINWSLLPLASNCAAFSTATPWPIGLNEATFKPVLCNSVTKPFTTGFMSEPAPIGATYNAYILVSFVKNKGV